MTFRRFAVLSLMIGMTPAAIAAPGAAAAVSNPIMFVTQVPIPIDFGTIASVFANHGASMREVGRGGDLYIRYPDGSLRNLTAEAGFGVASGLQGAGAIAVRDPAVHWSGSKAVFSMIVGGTSAQFQYDTFYWQLYEVSGLGAGQPVVITRVAQQPADYNNIAPTYASDGSIIFTSDRPRDGRRHLYPQLDEYESTATVSGLWKLNATSDVLQLIEHAPSGSFDPMVDSFGRILFTRWDHLQQDQQNEDSYSADCQSITFTQHGTFNFASEAIGAAALNDRSEVFPELRYARCRDNQGFTEHGMKFFLPWQINQDGSGEETLNHIGRHELVSYFPRSLATDPSLLDFARDNPTAVENMMQLAEDSTQPGRYVGIDAPEFATHAAGQLVRLLAPPTRNAAQMSIEYLTPRSTYGFSPQAGHSGHYRNPAVLADGQILVAHADEQGIAQNLGTRAAPNPSYKFRIKRLGTAAGGFLAPIENLTPGNGIVKNLAYWDPDVRVQYNGPMWELSPVEVRARSAPATTSWAVEAPEQQAFLLENVSEAAFRAFLRARGLAVVVMRNVTTRDSNDRQQPFNLRVPGGAQTLGDSGTVYDIAHMQFFQADLIRGHGGRANPAPGRRTLPQFLHDPVAGQFNAPNPGGPLGSTRIAADGSVAAFVPTQRALVWQSTAPDGRPVVRERYWINFQPGEIRACGGCHAVNAQGQAGQSGATNTAQAFRQLLARWRDTVSLDLLFDSGFED